MKLKFNPNINIDMKTETSNLPENKAMQYETLLATGLNRSDLLKNRRKNKMTYRECFGFENPPKGTELCIDHSEGIGFFIVWNDCPDDENIIEGWFSKRNEAVNYVKAHGWVS